LIPAVICGTIALARINKASGTLTGRRQAVVGLVTAGATIPLIGVIAVFIRSLNREERDYAHQLICVSNVRQIGMACAMYADSYDGNLPQNLDSLTNFVATTKYFTCPSAKDKSHYSYEFTGVTNKWGTDQHVVILREIEANHQDRRVVLFNDGHVESKRDTR
jgi:prepilin-type processing-associated H-X9-DG protein